MERGPIAGGVLGGIGVVRRANHWMHHAAGLALTVMLVLQVANIIGRKFFEYPILGTVELTRMLLAVVVFLGLAHSEDLGDHITIDLIYVRLGPRMRTAFNVFANLLSVGVIGLMAYQLFDYSSFTRGTGEETGILEWPIWPFVVVSAFGAGLYAVAIGLKLVLRALGEPIEADAPQSIGEVSGPEI